MCIMTICGFLCEMLFAHFCTDLSFSNQFVRIIYIFLMIIFKMCYPPSICSLPFIFFTVCSDERFLALM